MYRLSLIALLFSSTVYAQNCWGQPSRGPVRIAPMVSPITPPAKRTVDKDGWFWSQEQNCWLRFIKPHDVKKDSPAKKHGCGCRSSACECGDPCPCKETGRLCCKSCDCVLADNKGVKQDPTPNYGVDFSKLHIGTSYWINGKQVSKQQAYNEVRGQLQDDSAMEFVTVVGDRAFQDKVSGYLDALNARSKYRVQLYAPDNWVPRLRGYRQGVTLTDARGKVLAYAQDVQSADLLDQLLKRVRPPVSPSGPSGPLDIPTTVWVLCGLALALFLWSKKDAK